jgi:hypothetical protein
MGSIIYVHLWVEQIVSCLKHYFQLEMFFISLKRFLFSQDTAIFVRFEGIKSEYTLLKKIMI